MDGRFNIDWSINQQVYSWWRKAVKGTQGSVTGRLLVNSHPDEFKSSSYHSISSMKKDFYFYSCISPLILVLLILFNLGIIPSNFVNEKTSEEAFAASNPASSSDPSNGDGVSDTFASETGKYGISFMFQYNVLQTPAPINLFQNAIGGNSEISYGISKGIRILIGGGYLANTPHVSPPIEEFIHPSATGPSNQYAQAYAGIKLELTRWFPQMIRYQPWFPYIRADSGGAFASISDAGPLSGHPNGLLEDIGVGIEGRPRALPMAFFGEIRSQWLFFGPQILTIVPVMAGTTFYF